MALRTLAHYRLLEKIGAGGMGEVYRAHDERLGRDVAIKLLPAESFTDSTARLRLKREARAAAALNHPHICVVHDVGEVDTQPYIAMELVAGETLSDRLSAGALSPQQVIRYGIELADALSHAHDRGVIHRDLKGSNVVITADGHVKVLDFGLAKRAVDGGSSQAGTEPLHVVTQEGTIVGTPAYMAPEQLRGQAAHARSDIWALGVMLFEMAAGTRPFSGGTWFELSSAILNGEPQPLPASVPPELGAVVRRCLEKDPARRYQSASEVRVALETVQSGSAPRPIPRPRAGRTVFMTMILLAIAGTAVVTWRKQTVVEPPRALVSVAVLPIANTTGDPEQQFFIDGVHAGLIAELARVRDLRVISRLSSAKYRDTTKSVPEIAGELGVDQIIELAMTRSGERLTMQVQLVSARPEERQIWSERIERDIADVPALQKAVVRGVAEAMGVVLTPEERTRLTSARRVDREAYELYLRGMHQLNTFTRDGYKKGLAYLHEAVDKDPADPNAYAGLAVGYALVGHGSGAGSGPEAFAKARAAAQRALELDENNAEAMGAMAEVKAYYEWDWEEARRAYQRSLELNPNADEVRRHYAWLHALEWRMDDAYREMRTAQEINPLRPVVFAEMGWLLVYAGEYDRAILEARKALEINLRAVNAWNVLGMAYAGKGMYEESLEAHGKAREINPGSPLPIAGALAKAGRTAEARAVLAEALAAPNPEERAFGLARVHALLGDVDEAFHWADVAYKTRYWAFPWIFHETIFREQRKDPRYREMMARINVRLPASF